MQVFTRAKRGKANKVIWVFECNALTLYSANAGLHPNDVKWNPIEHEKEPPKGKATASTRETQERKEATVSLTSAKRITAANWNPPSAKDRDTAEHTRTKPDSTAHHGRNTQKPNSGRDESKHRAAKNVCQLLCCKLNF